MEYIQCPENEATHVRVSEDETRMDLLNLTLGKEYKILRNTDPSFEGEEMIESDDGNYVCSFSLLLNVEWLKEVLH